MPRKKRHVTPFGAEVEPLGAYIVRVQYHREQDFVTEDSGLVRAVCDAFDRHGWKYKIERLDWHRVPKQRSAST
jgi:hypothetical protein